MARDLSKLRSTHSIAEFKRLIRKYPNRPVVVSEGDSWFDYPPKNLIFGAESNIIDFIERKRRFNLLRLEKNGDEVVTMTSGRQGKRLARVLRDFHVNVLLFSGGGNDIVGSSIDMLLRKKLNGMSWRECIDDKRFERRLVQIEHAFRLLIDMKEDYSRNQDLVIIAHTYDHPIPSSQGAIFWGGLIKTKSWMEPYMIKKGITEQEDQNRVSRHLIDGLAQVLKKVEAEHKDCFVVVDTRQTLKGDDWLNEIHASNKGCKKLADKMFAKMKDYL